MRKVGIADLHGHVRLSVPHLLKVRVIGPVRIKAIGQHFLFVGARYDEDPAREQVDGNAVDRELGDAAVIASDASHIFLMMQWEGNGT